ncbi:DUF6779 domain-containing protein [Nocardia blacklockiae]|uniref:DUF6779 domain-containing protein n=1 Tax=Nocardia blacklockiae TaxID=480036 RepID=UPI001895A871|nr:DUF6779 domain-containing protein [Nocardia blacklockiae]MBF6173194.1 hypothetical protein [Nocardia blacklockiae]
MTRVGLVAALWSAAIGVLAATRYRRESAVDRVKMRDLQTVYELQLRREIAARHEYELGVESRVRAEVGAEAAEMAALRAELAVLRESLQRLFDGDLPVERPALRADVVRVPELPSRSANGSSPDTDTWDAWSVPAVPRGSVTPVFEAGHPEPPVFAGPDDDPVTAETSVVAADGEQPAPAPGNKWSAWVGAGDHDPYPSDSWTAWSESPEKKTDTAESAAGRPGSPDPEPVEDEEPDESASLDAARGDQVNDTGRNNHVLDAGRDDREPEPAPDEPTRPSDAETNGATRPAAPSETTEKSRTQTKVPTAIGTAGTRRRRRAEAGDGEHGGHQLTVAEIMANLRSEQNSSN